VKFHCNQLYYQAKHYQTQIHLQQANKYTHGLYELFVNIQIYVWYSYIYPQFLILDNHHPNQMMQSKARSIYFDMEIFYLSKCKADSLI